MVRNVNRVNLHIGIPVSLSLFLKFLIYFYLLTFFNSVANDADFFAIFNFMTRKQQDVGKVISILLSQTQRNVHENKQNYVHGTLSVLITYMTDITANGQDINGYTIICLINLTTYSDLFI